MRATITIMDSHGTTPLWVRPRGLYPQSSFTAGFNTRWGGKFLDVKVE